MCRVVDCSALSDKVEALVDRKRMFILSLIYFFVQNFLFALVNKGTTAEPTWWEQVQQVLNNLFSLPCILIVTILSLFHMH